MDLVRALTRLEQSPELHEARLLVLLGAFAGRDGAGQIVGLTKLAKLDFLLRYPVLLERALSKKRESTANIAIQEHERQSVESHMVRYRFGPWDHRYRMLLNLLVAKGFATIQLDGRTVRIGLTESGLSAAERLANSDAFADIRLRARALHTHFDISATHLMRFVYDTFPEVLSMRKNETIAL